MWLSHPSKLLSIKYLRRQHIPLSLPLLPLLPHELPHLLHARGRYVYGDKLYGPGGQHHLDHLLAVLYLHRETLLIITISSLPHLLVATTNAEEYSHTHPFGFFLVLQSSSYSARSSAQVLWLLTPSVYLSARESKCMNYVGDGTFFQRLFIESMWVSLKWKTNRSFETIHPQSQYMTFFLPRTIRRMYKMLRMFQIGSEQFSFFQVLPFCPPVSSTA